MGSDTLGEILIGHRIVGDYFIWEAVAPERGSVWSLACSLGQSDAGFGAACYSQGRHLRDWMSAALRA